MTGTMPEFDFAGQVVLVTGGSRGIGHAIASAFADAGANVHITGTRTAADGYADDLSRFAYHQCRLENEAERAALSESFDTLDILVNNAGTSRDDEYQIEGFLRVMDVNITAVADLCFRFRDRLAANAGAIINIGSVAGSVAVRENPGYTASKHAENGLTKVLADKWARLGIRVNGVAPGFIVTRISEWSRLDAETERYFQRQIPMRRFGQPSEVAPVVLFLASAGASYLCGHTVQIDGGYLLR